MWRPWMGNNPSPTSSDHSNNGRMAKVGMETGQIDDNEGKFTFSCLVLIFIT